MKTAQADGRGTGPPEGEKDMKKRALSLLLALSLLAGLLPVLSEAVDLDALVREIDGEAKALTVQPLTYEVSPDRQSIFIDRPAISGSGSYTVAYNIYDSNSVPVNYFYSDEPRVAATPGYGGLFNVFVVVTDLGLGEMTTLNLTCWEQLSWPHADRLQVGKAKWSVSGDGKSIFIDRPEIRCAGGSVTIAYNIYDADSNPVNYFYSDLGRVAATPGYDGLFNVFIVVTDTVTGEQDVQNIGWVTLEETVETYPEDEGEGEWPVVIDKAVYDLVDGEATVLSVDQTILIWLNGGEYDPEFDVTLRSRVYKHDVTAISRGAYGYFGQRRSIGGTLTLPARIRSIGESAFADCQNISAVKGLGGTVERVGEEAFKDCFRMKGTVQLGAACVEIGDRAFENCTQLRGSINVGENCVIGTDAFRNTSLTVTQTGKKKWYATVDGVYYRYEKGVLTAEGLQSGVRTLKLADKVNGVPLTDIGKGAFKGMTFLEGALNIPASVNHIWHSAFEGCTGLTSLSIPGKAVLEQDAFKNCSGLKGELVLNDKVTWTYMDFGGCGYSLIRNESDTRFMAVVDGIRYWVSDRNGEYSASELVAIDALAETKQIRFAETVRGCELKQIGPQAFSGRRDLKGSLVFPETVYSISNFAFSYCSGLTGQLVFPAGIKSIGSSAFTDCTGFTGEVHIPRGCWLGFDVFDGTNLTVVQ